MGEYINKDGKNRVTKTYIIQLKGSLKEEKTFEKFLNDFAENEEFYDFNWTKFYSLISLQSGTRNI